MNKAYDFLVEPIRRNFAFFLMIFMLGFIPAFIDIINNEAFSLVLMKTVGLLGCNFFISFGMTVCVDKWLGKWGKIFVLALWTILFIIESLILFVYDSLISPSFVFILFSTNLSEAMEFLSSMANSDNCALFFSITILLIISCLGIFKIKINVLRVNKKVAFVITSFLLLFGLSVFIFTIKRLPNIISYRLMPPIERVIISIWLTAEDIKSINELSEKKDFKSPVLLSNNSEIKNIVVILGESLSRTKMSSYGYHLQTTPLLEQRLADGTACLFTDVITPFGATGEAVKNIMTSLNTDNHADWLKSEVISDVMEEAGYTTYWLSNQESFGAFVNVQTVIANCFDIVRFTGTKNSREEEAGSYDEELVPLVANVLNDSSEKRFVVIHLMGNHAHYKNRYPASFSHFSSKDITDKNGNHAEVISEYLNSILYNDYVINNVLKILDTKESLVFYLSDHGEEVYDVREYFGHGLTLYSKYIAEVPFIVYFSNQFRNKYPEKEAKIRSSIEHRFMTDDLFHTILDIADIKTTSFETNRSLFDPCTKDRIRIFNKERNYDTDLKDEN